MTDDNGSNGPTSSGGPVDSTQFCKQNYIEIDEILSSTFPTIAQIFATNIKKTGIDNLHILASEIQNRSRLTSYNNIAKVVAIVRLQQRYEASSCKTTESY